MILVWGVPDDSPTSAVLGALRHNRVPVIFLDQRYTLSTTIDGDLSGAGYPTLSWGSMRCRLGDVRASYVRPVGWRSTPTPDPREAITRVKLCETICAWADVADAIVINRPASMASNASKPLQLELIREVGFEIPDTIVTSDKSVAEAFVDTHSSVIFKSTSGIRSIVSKFETSHRERLELLRWCPVQFQEYIDGCDYRVHVVGDEIFICRIVSRAVDYRYAERQGTAVEMSTAEIPQSCVERCFELTRRSGLLVSGIDLRESADGKWFCFEVNPSPAFTYYENQTDQPIGNAIAALLQSKPR